MNIHEILSKVDHTLLSQTATWEEIKAICDDGIKYQTASVCIPSAYVKQAADYVQGKVAICTVIGFPNGYVPTAIKCEEARLAIEDGADEIDMVINIGDCKDHNYEKIEEEIRTLKEACGDHILKVIIETCYLTDEEKIAMCKAVTNAKADYIKTSTGFGTAGATMEDILLFKANIGPDVKMKAAGGIRSVQDMEDYLAVGVDRLGTSSAIKLIEGQEAKGY